VSQETADPEAANQEKGVPAGSSRDSGRQGERVLATTYETGGTKWPVGYEAWEAAARQRLEQHAFDYIAGGAGSELTVRANGEAFYRVRLVPRMLRGTAERDLSVEVLGTRSPHPFMLAPLGVQSVAHPDAELATARAARATGTPMLISSAASTAMEPTAEALGETPRWFQLYWVNDREIVESLVRRAEASGCGAIVLTLDTLHLGWRDRDLRNHAFLPFLGAQGIAQFTSDPVFRSRLSETPEENPLLAGATWVSMFPNLGLTWEDTAWLRALTRLPLLAKGLLSAADAQRAVEAGFDGVIVSNHGGRQVDGEIAALDALPAVRAAVGTTFPVLMDSGVRRGSDILKAIALGADCVLIGRPYAWGLAVGGQEGVEEVIRSIAAETDLTLALVGARSPRELDPSFIAIGRR
jgi:isopentenyl diphosphate isomerase/L-lactate dehydrogenase-like FMN-dependent dehydrogenase